MAVLRFSDGKTVEVSAETGVRIWEILNGRAEPENDREEMICSKVNKIYLNWRTAPDDYIRERFEIIAPMVVSNWMVEGTPTGNHQHTSIGLPTRPQPADKFIRDFSKKWGLLKGGMATPLARKYI